MEVGFKIILLNEAKGSRTQNYGYFLSNNSISENRLRVLL